MTTPAPYVVLSAVTVEGVLMPARTVVSLVPGSSLWTAYGGSGNLQVLPLDQQGDDADHANLGN